VLVVGVCAVLDGSVARDGPTGHVFNVRDVYLSAGAGFMVVPSGDTMTMTMPMPGPPGRYTPRHSAFDRTPVAS
jgi:formyltetrahydrofolate synthetase